MADDVAQAQLAHLLGGQPEVLEERPIDVVTMLLAIDIGDRRRHAVHDDAQLRLARRESVLRFLHVGDVVADDVDALDAAVERVVRHHPPAHPSHAAARVLERTLVDQCLAGKRAVVERRQRLRCFETDHLLGRLADHLVAIEAVQLQERLVDERVLAIGVEVDNNVLPVVARYLLLNLAAGVVVRQSAIL